MHTQHREIAIRIDQEPSVCAIADAVKRFCRSMGIAVHDEAAQLGDRQANGAAEVTVQQIRARTKLGGCCAFQDCLATGGRVNGSRPCKARGCCSGPLFTCLEEACEIYYFSCGCRVVEVGSYSYPDAIL